MKQKRVLSVVALIALAALAQGASCGQSAPRHKAHLSLNAFAKGLAGVQQVEAVLYQAGTVPTLTPATHAAFKAKLVKVAMMADEAQTVLDAWVPGQPVPKVLGPVMVAAKDLMRDLLALIPTDPSVRDAVDSVYSAIADILILITG